MSFTDKELDKALSKAKIGLMSQHNSVFITTILFSLKQSWDKNLNPPTAGVNGTNLYLHPDWFMGLTPKARIALLAHEAWHVAFDHMGRKNTRNHKKYNIAGDYVINIQLQDNGYELPPNGYVDAKFRDMSTNQVYDLIPDPPEGPESEGDWSGDMKEPTDGDAEGEAHKVKAILVKAMTQSKVSGDKAGTIPGDIERHLGDLISPKLNWRVLLQNYMTAFDKNDYSYVKPNRRFMPDFYLPSLYGEGLDEICVAVDTSGSVSDSDFIAFISEINYIKEVLNPKLLKIIDFDTKVQNVYELSPDDDVTTTVKFNGYGGTDLRPVFDHYGKRKPDVLIVFSDLYCSKIRDDPGYPVLWVIIDNENAEVNFGTKIHYDTAA